MKEIVILLLISFPVVLIGQNVGVGTVNPQEKLDVLGNINLTGTIKVNNNMGANGQFLKSNGNGTMQWEYNLPMGALIEVDPGTTDTSLLRQQGYKLMGKETKTITKTTPAAGLWTTHYINTPQVKPEDLVFYHTVGAQYVIVDTVSSLGSITLIKDFDPFAVQKYTMSFNIKNAVFTQTKILMYPDGIFDVASGITSAFPANTICPAVGYGEYQVWSGSELLMWGSTGGAKFNPSTNTWTCMSTANAPAYRTDAVFTWTGTELFIYGGRNGASYAISGRRYNPATNIWTTVSTVGSPLMFFGTAVWTGPDVIVYGGVNEAWVISGFTTASSGSYKYNLSANTWTAIAGGPGARKPKLFLASGYLVLLTRHDFSAAKDETGIARYNISTNTWQTLDNIAESLIISVASTGFSSGSNITIFPGDAAYLNLLNYNVSTNTFNPGYFSSLARNKTEMAINNGVLFAFGGNAYDNTYLGDGRYYNPAINVWQIASSTNQPTPRNGHSVTSQSTNLFYVWGGYNGVSYLGSGSYFNRSNNTWTNMTFTGSPSARSNHIAVNTGTSLIIWGGNNGSSDLNTGGVYNFAGNTWSVMSTVNAPVAYDSAVGFWTGTEMIVWSKNSGGLYNPATNTWTLLSATGAPDYTIYNGAWTGTELILLGVKSNKGIIHIYSLATDTWRTGDMESYSLTNPYSAPYFKSIYVDNSFLILKSTGFYSGLNHDRYDPAANTWSQVNDIPNGFKDDRFFLFNPSPNVVMNPYGNPDAGFPNRHIWELTLNTGPAFNNTYNVERLIYKKY